MLRARLWSCSVWWIAAWIGCEAAQPDEACIGLTGNCNTRCTKLVGWVGEPSPHGVVPEADLNYPEEKWRTMLPLRPDRVAAVTLHGDTIECTTSRAGAYYVCRSDAGIREVSVQVGDQRISRSTDNLQCGDYWLWEYHSGGPGINFWLDALPACVSPEAEALTGQLLDYDPAVHPPVSVTLTGMPIDFDDTYDFWRAPDEITPSVACEIEGTTYHCPALGYRSTERHVLVTKVGDHQTRTALILPVQDCQPELVTQDVTPCPTEKHPCL